MTQKPLNIIANQPMMNAFSFRGVLFFFDVNHFTLIKMKMSIYYPGIW